jgi:hypothetical protein
MQCEKNHLDIPTGSVCPRCGKTVLRDEYGREIDAPETSRDLERRQNQWYERGYALLGIPFPTE